MSESNLLICLIAGEASGDALGAPLMAALAAQVGRPVRFSGVGGLLMTAQGLQSLFPMEELSVMGIAEIVPSLPRLLRRIQETVAHIETTKPDIVITIDAPDFVFRVVKKFKDNVILRESGGSRRRGETFNGIPAFAGMTPIFIHYIAPSVWAWRAKRAAKIAKLYDGLLCVLPFEPPYFTREGMDAIFVGHPVLERGLASGDGARFRVHHGILHSKKTLGLLFGSRRGEARRIGPALRDAAIRLARTHPDLHLIAPTVPHMRAAVAALLEEIPLPSTVVVEEKADAFAAMDAALAASGTVALELAVAGVPHAIAYRMNAATAWLLRRFLRVRFAHLANILLDRAAVPEFLQERCTPENLTAAGAALLDDPAVRETQRRDFAEAVALLQGADELTPAARAARFILARVSR